MCKIEIADMNGSSTVTVQHGILNCLIETENEFEMKHQRQLTIKKDNSTNEAQRATRSASSGLLAMY